MAKKKKEIVEITKVESDSMPPSLKLDFTGKMSMVVELADYGPMEFRIDDKETVLKILRLLMEETGHITTVDAYNKRTGNTLKKLLDF